MTAYKTRGAAISGSALWTPAGPTRDGWIIQTSMSNITSAGTEAPSKTTYTKANQPQNDLVEVLSSDALDITQSVTLYGIDLDGNRVSETVALDVTDGTTVMPSTSYFQYIENARLSAACVGTVTIQEASANADIVTITIGDLVSYIGHLYTGHLTGYLVSAYCTTTTITGNVTFSIRWYPAAAGSVSGTGFEVIDTITVLDTEGVFPDMRVYPIMKSLAPGGYLTVSCVGEGGDDEDVSITLMGFWEP